MTILLTDSSDESSRYTFTLGDSLRVTTSTYELYDTVAADIGEQLIVIGPNIKLETVRSVAEHFRAARPSLGVILLRPRLEIGILTEALRYGIREVVAVDDASALVAACKRSLEVSSQLDEISNTSRSGKSPGKILICFSAKGGCGKTTLSVNLAYALAMQTNKRVALLDFDLQFGDVAVALQIEPTKTISDAIPMQNSLDSMGVDSIMVSQLENLHVLLAPTNPTDVEFISVELVDTLLMNLRNNYDYIVVDTPPAFTDVVLRIFDQADKCFLLTTLDMPSIKNLKLVIGTLEALNVKKSRLEFVLNKSDQKTGITSAEAQEMLGESFSTFIPLSNEVSSATNRGLPIVVDKPKNPVSKSIKGLAKKTHEHFYPDENRKKSGLFKRGIR
jgi:pilus assembly protein CpaE